MRVYLADLANQLVELDNKSIPIGVGYVGSYCQKVHAESVEVSVFRTFHQLRKAVLSAPPDIAGFGSYDWNSNLSLQAASFIKDINPDCVTVMGGANVEVSPKDNAEFLEAHKQIDCLIYGDGEYAFADLVGVAIEALAKGEVAINLVKKAAIDGVRALHLGELIMGLPSNIVRNLDEIPSPYLTGLFDELLNDPNLMPIIQNVRGCPYLCKYCVSGSQSGKVRHFSYDRITEEIEYLRKKAKNRFLRLSDDNFGIIEHDVQVGSYIRESFDNHGYPVGLKAYSAKRLTERTRRLAVILKPLMLMCISLQTTTPEVLKATKRTSATRDEALSGLEFARQNGIATATELIFGLPGETLESMKKVINATVEMRFDSIAINVLWLLKGAELYRPEMRDQFGYKGKFMLAENAITLDDNFISTECDEIAVESKHFSYADWKRFLLYEFLLKMCYHYGYAKEMLLHALLSQIEATDIFDEIIDKPEQYPEASSLAFRYQKNYTKHMYENEDALKRDVQKRIDELRGDKEKTVSLSKHRMLYSFIVEAFFEDDDPGFLRDIHRACVALYSGENTLVFKRESEQLLKFSKQMIVNPKREFVEEIETKSDFNISEWISEGYRYPLSNYAIKEPREFVLVSRNSVSVKSAIKRDADQDRTDCYNFFRYMNSSLMRRTVQETVLVSPSAEGRHPHYNHPN